MSSSGENKKTKHISKYYIGICELHHDLLHGFNESSSSQIKGHYLLMEKFNNFHKYIINDVYNYHYDSDDSDDSDNSVNSDNSNSSIVDSDDENENNNPKLIDLYRYKYSILLKSPTFMNSCHSIIRNYHNIIKSFYYIQPHIVECVYLPGGECVAVLKTFWLKIVQRTWKRVYKQRMQLLCSVPMLRMREIRGGNTCFQYEKIHIPGLRGMLQF
jgi:hypothetical protein